MNAPVFAELTNARSIGPGRWMARCPAHPDKSPSLSIREGRDQRVLINCFAGCTHTAIAQALGIKISDLFSTKPLSPEQATEAARRKTFEDRRHQVKRARERALEDKVRRLDALQDAIGAKLARTTDDATEGNELTRLFHSVCDLHRTAVTELEAMYQDKSPAGTGLKEGHTQHV